ncbi:hypothetical protein ONS95_001150 [Cadophora gregata]|uniref:uncharacterized protein n=1 Tax=Cadophora gregata TaxID=51156 RepID=UPI0026DBF7DC|nr:uncharacterized protein ONS95_001150 [Cadophora gregata]KAK0129215.1 hypothetical protein ONS95_001150 [Cadophora gregata]
MPKRKSDSASATANLIRVRNNQRRSRARRREYVAELERKLKECEVEGVPTCSIVPEDTIRRLQEENRKLRELLRQVGIEQITVEQYLTNHDDNNPRETVGIVVNELVASAGLQIPSWTSDVVEADSLQAAAATLPEYIDELLVDTFLNLPDDSFSDPDLGRLLDTAQEGPVSDPIMLPSHSPSALCTAPSSSTPADAPSFFCPESSLPVTSQCDTETTLCSDAYEMLRQHNKKGVDMIEIGIRLWNGFTKGDERGCKVENKLLFSVLEYISG